MTPPPPRAPLTRAILDALDQGIILCDPAVDEILYANAAGAQALSLLGGAGRVPVGLRAAIGPAAALPSDRLSRAVEVAAPSGARFYARARRLGVAPPGVLLVLSPARVRHADLVALLHQRFGLSHREGECVALLRDGLRNGAIAARLGLTAGTVRQYLVAIYEIVGVKTRGELVALVHELAQEQEESVQQGCKKPPTLPNKC